MVLIDDMSTYRLGHPHTIMNIRYDDHHHGDDGGLITTSRSSHCDHLSR